MTFLGIDLGTSFIKGAILDLDEVRIEHIQRIPFPAPLPGLPPLFREFDPISILSAVKNLLDGLLPHAGNCEGLVMCGQMHSLIFITGQGEPRSNLSTWQDQRSLQPHPSGQGSYFDMLKSRLSQEEIRLLGNELRPGLPIAHLFWLTEQAHLPVGLYPASLLEFVVSNLCGCPPAMDRTNANAHGALNLVTMDWHPDVLLRFGLDRLSWPRVQPYTEPAGWLQAGSRRIPCYPPFGDYQCALAGAMLDYEELSLNISTGSQVSLLRPQAEFGEYQTRPFFDGRFLSTITHLPAGRALNLLIKLLSELAAAQGLELPDPWPYISRQASLVDAVEMRVNLSFFTNPSGDHGEITNLREPEMTVGHLFRASFENMADTYYRCALQISPEPTWRRLVFSGGLAQKLEILREAIAEKFQVATRVCLTEEDTLSGMLAIAQVISGRQPSVERATADLRQKQKVGTS